MCGRFGSSFDAKELSLRFSLDKKPPFFQQSFNIAPSFTIPVITRNSPNKAVLMHWGFVPNWTNPNKIKIKPINARDEQLFISNFYKNAIATARCIIPFSFFYEWNSTKQPYLIKVKDKTIMGFAGIYSEIKDAEGFPYYTCAIITIKPNKLMAKIHNRMPVILNEQDEDCWLDKSTSLIKVKQIIKPYDDNKMEAYKISTQINSPANDGEYLIKELS